MGIGDVGDMRVQGECGVASRVGIKSRRVLDGEYIIRNTSEVG